MSLVVSLRRRTGWPKVADSRRGFGLNADAALVDAYRDELAVADERDGGDFAGGQDSAHLHFDGGLLAEGLFLSEQRLVG